MNGDCLPNNVLITSEIRVIAHVIVNGDLMQARLLLLEERDLLVEDHLARGQVYVSPISHALLELFCLGFGVGSFTRRLVKCDCICGVRVFIRLLFS